MIPLYFQKTAYAQRRKAILDQLTPGKDVFIFFNAPEATRNADTLYKYRPDSSFVYLTGFAEPQSALILFRKSAKESLFYLFTMPRDPAREQWDGYRYGPEGAKKLCGATKTFVISDLKNVILDILTKEVTKGVSPRIISNIGIHAEHKKTLERILEDHHPKERMGEKPVEAMIAAAPLVNLERLIKSPEEIKVMRKSSEINMEAHEKVMRAIKPGVRENHLQAIVEAHYIHNDCYDPSYYPICAGGSNATILHYHENNATLKAKELFLIDAGCEYQFYASDITRTIPVSGTYTRAQRMFMDLVHEAHQEALHHCRVGNAWNLPHLKATQVLAEGMKQLKLDKEPIKRYYPHGTSHWLGMDVHDPCPYKDEKGEDLKLQEGMVLTIEPGIYFLPDDKTVPTEYRGIGIRIEDDIVIGKTKPRNLTEELPRSAAAIEKFMKKKSAS